MDITIDKIGAEPLEIPESPAKKPAAVEVNPRAEEDRGKTSESGIREPVSNQQARELTEKLQRYIDRMNINIAFSTYGEKDKNIAIIVSEKETGKLIREIPPEELQRLHVKMEEIAGMIFSGMA
ncbi:MAG: flagellar protein FlaG [Syntrophobacterales bacterium]|nr:flagellar protein FlaG [Syntrophobacterales bacterium]